MNNRFYVLALSGATLIACQGLVGFGDPPMLRDDADSGPAIDAASPDASAPLVDASPDVQPDASDPPDANPCRADASDFYVRGPSPCAFETITAAIVAARASHAATRTVHVAPGVYKAPAETLPLDLRGGISLQGEGTSPADTVITGLGVLDHRLEGGELSSTANVTIATGSPTVASRVANLRLLSGDDAVAANGIGIYCDRGNAVPWPAAQPSPSLVVDRVIVEHGYGVGINVSNSTYPKSGCNARITSATFNAAWLQFTWYGVTVGGCDLTTDSARTALELGDGTDAHKNLFEDMGRGDGSTGAVAAFRCTASLLVRGNHFDTGEAGIRLASKGGESHVAITNNRFSGQAIGGIQLREEAVIDTLTDNRFEGCDVAGVWVVSGRAQILSARKNSFIGNRRGVAIFGDPVTGVLDFGTPSSHGENEFRCNASTDGDYGYDLGQHYPAGPGGFVTAYGNAWDHEPPSRAIEVTANGLDVLLPPSGALPDVGGATQASSTCPIGRSAGTP